MRKGNTPYIPPAWSDEDARLLLNWLSTRTTDDGRRVHPDYLYDRRRIESNLRLARAHKLTVRAGVYLPLPPSSKGASHRGRSRVRQAA